MSMTLRPAWSTYRVPEQLRLHGETLPQIQTSKKCLVCFYLNVFLCVSVLMCVCVHMHVTVYKVEVIGQLSGINYLFSTVWVPEIQVTESRLWQVHFSPEPSTFP